MRADVAQCASLLPPQTLSRTEQAPALIAGEEIESRSMLDIVMLAIGLGFFALSVAYAYACDRL